MRQCGRGKLLAAIGASACVGVLVTAALASPSRPAAAVRFELVSMPSCKGTTPVTTRLGRACVDHKTIPNWTIKDGSATVELKDQWLTTYSWTLPQTVLPLPTGASLKLNAAGEEKTGRPNSRICPAISVRSGFTLKGESQPAGLGFCAEAIVKPKAGDSKTLKLLPPASSAPGSTITLTIGVQYGVNYIYTYRAVAAKKKAKPKPRPICRRPQALRPTGIPNASRDEPECVYFFTYSFDFKDPGESARGHGKVGGKNYKQQLEPMSNPDDDDENFIHLASGKTRVLLDVESAYHTSRKGKERELDQLGFETVVIRSNTEDCPKGTRVHVDVAERDDGRNEFHLDKTRGCKWLFSVLGSLQDAVKIDFGAEVR